MTAPLMLDIKNLGKRFPARAGREPPPWIIQDMSFSVGAGELLTIVGPSGAGKSTLISLLQRLVDVDEGRVLIDDQDIRAMRQDSLRAAIAVVPQEISLFHRSVLENIRYARPERRAATSLSGHCRRAMTRSSGSAARSCRVGSASVSASPGPS